jgi:hypothetical protein
MNLKINRHLLTQTRWDSAALNPLAAVLHRFESPGTYPGMVFIEKTAVALFDLIVDEAAPETQVNVDLELLQQRGYVHSGGNVSFVVSPRQPTLFYAPRGRGGYTVVVHRTQDRQGGVEFTNRELKEGDVYMLAPILTGMYSMRTQGTARGEITVFKRGARSIPTQPVYIECTDHGFSPPAARCEFSQPLFFVLKTPARIVVQFEKQVEG